MNSFYKFILGVLTMVLILFGIKVGLESKGPKGDSKTVYLYNWGDYLDPDILASFEEETGYKVVYETFDSNEAMLTKIEQGATAYDVAVPSEYTVDMMIARDMLLPLDHSKLEGLENIDPRFLDWSFDPGNKYSVPFFWGTLGLVYNTKKYTEEDVDSWANLWDPKFKNEIIIYDGARETMGVGLLKNRMSLNSKDIDDLEYVRKDLRGMMANVKAILADEIKMYLAQEEANVGITFSGEAASALAENENLAYHIPREGANIWFDNLVIPKTSKNVDGAHALISYLMRPEIAAQNADYIWYSTPNKAAMDLIDPEALEDETLYPSEEVISKLEVFENLGQEMTIIYNDMFLDLKISPQVK